MNVSPAFFSVNAMNDAKDGAASCEHAPARSREGSLFYLLSAGFSAGLSAVFSADSLPDAFAWGVRAVGLPGNLSVYGVGDTLDEALLDLGEGIRTALADGPIPEELTREITVVLGDAA